MLHQRQAFTCPCCQGFIGEAAPIEFVLENVARGQQSQILGLLAKRVGRIVAKETLVDQLYGDRSDGGPNGAGRSIDAQLTYLRRRLEPFGWTIFRSGGGHGAPSFYRLIPREAGAC